MFLKIQFYILSLWLLFFLFFIINLDISFCFEDCKFIGLKNLLLDNIISAICLIFIVFGTIIYFNFKYIVQGNKSLPEKIVDIENINWEHLTFLVTYIVPLLSFNISENKNFLLIALILIIIGIIYIKTNMFYTNPTLALLGYQIYKVNTTNKKKIIVITRSLLTKDDWIAYKSLGEGVYFANKIQK
ncbi:anti-phage protein KwaA [Epilithonimonas vandammei]|uniref:anti-phage protein KwaA n=1 Tax=Epilithonimonas vandammei TaxID=2487072 RepID=UPI0028B1F78F|nr:anti-phage protein KwaA [Epilithonimonas vandammei]